MAGIDQFSLTYQKAPIILNGGIAANLPGGLMPLISISDATNFPQGVLQGGSSMSLDDFMFDFEPMPGGTLIDNQVGTYPFANQTVAANAVITQPLRFAMLMVAPARGPGAFRNKIAAFQAIQAALAQHTSLGGTYTVATPSYLYTDCLLLTLRDVSSGNPGQVQSMWQWDFFQPLLTLDSAQAAQNALMQKVTAGTKITPNANGEISYSGQAPVVGNAASVTGPSVIPAAQGLGGASVGSTTTVGYVKNDGTSGLLHLPNSGPVFSGSGAP